MTTRTLCTILITTFLTSCTYQKDNYIELQGTPTIDQKLQELNHELQLIRQELNSGAL